MSDEYDPGWPLEGLAQTIRSALLLVAEVERSPAPPQWKGRPPFPMQK